MTTRWSKAENDSRAVWITNWVLQTSNDEECCMPLFRYVNAINRRIWFFDRYRLSTCLYDNNYIRHKRLTHKRYQAKPKNVRVNNDTWENVINCRLFCSFSQTLIKFFTEVCERTVYGQQNFDIKVKKCFCKERSLKIFKIR